MSNEEAVIRSVSDILEAAGSERLDGAVKCSNEQRV